MDVPKKLKETLNKLGIDSSIYNARARKCILSRKKMNLENVPWYHKAYFVDENFDKSGFFIFDPVSLVPCIALDTHKNDSILDMCAAPGTKTFIMSFMTGNSASITANDIDRHRIKRLRHNAERFGINCNITNMSGRKIEENFNKILLDAPCSGEGMINKKEKLFRHWSPKRVKFLARKQKKLVSHAFKILEPKGILVYSTCTLNVEENEAVVSFLLDKFDNAATEKIDANIVHTTGIAVFEGKEFHNAVKNCIRIYPMHNSTGGFFVAKIKKK